MTKGDEAAFVIPKGLNKREDRIRLLRFRIQMAKGEITFRNIQISKLEQEIAELSKEDGKQ